MKAAGFVCVARHGSGLWSVLKTGPLPGVLGHRAGSDVAVEILNPNGIDMPLTHAPHCHRVGITESRWAGSPNAPLPLAPSFSRALVI